MSSNEKPYGTLTCIVEDADGDIVETVQQDIDSYVVQWLQAHRAFYGNVDVSGVTDTGNTDRTIENGSDNSTRLRLDAGSGVTGHGIQIGSDSTSEAIDDHSLGTQLTSSINYGTTNVNSVTTASGSATMSIVRTFENQTGSSVDVSEVGVVFQCNDTGNSKRSFLGLRDTGSPIVSVSNTDTLTVDYELEVSV